MVLANGRVDDVNINFSPTYFHVLSPEEVISHPELIQDIIVLVGAMYEDADCHWTPIGKIAGVELLAYGVQSLLYGKEMHNQPFPPPLSGFVRFDFLRRSAATHVSQQNVQGQEYLCTLHYRLNIHHEHLHLPVHIHTLGPESPRIQTLRPEFQPCLGTICHHLPRYVPQYVQCPPRLHQRMD